MFKAQFTFGNTLTLHGRLDSAQIDILRDSLERIEENYTIDFTDLVYISSAGLAVLVSAQKRLNRMSKTLKLKNLNSHIREVFTMARFHLIFEIE